MLFPSDPRAAQQFPEFSWLEDGQGGFVLDGEQIRIARHKNIGLAGHGSCQDPSIGRITHVHWAWFGRSRDDLESDEHGIYGGKSIGGKTQFLFQNAVELVEDDLPEHEIMLGQHHPYHIRTKTTRCECSNQDIGVEAHPHDIALKTSSSVR